MKSQPVRLQKYFTDCGILSRRAAEAAIENGEVTVNGRCAEIGMKIDPKKDKVFYQGKAVLPPEKEGYTYLLLNKPRGYLTSVSDDRGRKCVTELIPPEYGRLYPVGRLDLISEGLLILTDDGDFANFMTHPGHDIPKVYRVKVAGKVSPEQFERLTSPMKIDGYQLRPIEAVLGEEDESGTVLRITLYEGRNRQIRKMCEEVGLQVKRLCRVAIGKIKLDNLPLGKVRLLSDTEVAALKKAAVKK